MHTALIGLFDKYEQAEAAVQDLGLAGVVGEEIEVISDVDEDARAEALGFQPHEGIGERIARMLKGWRKPGTKDGGDTEVHDDPGDMPNYIGEQEFYATHVKKEGAILVVRTPSRTLAGLAEAILKDHGSKTRDGNAGVLTVEAEDQPRQRARGAN
ncbi:MAG TPA: hypothetical protein VHX49_09420 [Candidatus Acidoferrales bacterium]|jgi:hypothetical protein|nr:hypothetical protein [Candidatus Acidoferrales bacterium]